MQSDAIPVDDGLVELEAFFPVFMEALFGEEASREVMRLIKQPEECLRTPRTFFQRVGRAAEEYRKTGDPLSNDKLRALVLKDAMPNRALQSRHQQSTAPAIREENGWPELAETSAFLARAREHLPGTSLRAVLNASLEEIRFVEVVVPGAHVLLFSDGVPFETWAETALSQLRRVVEVAYAPLVGGLLRICRALGGSSDPPPREIGKLIRACKQEGAQSAIRVPGCVLIDNAVIARNSDAHCNTVFDLEGEKVVLVNRSSHGERREELKRGDLEALLLRTAKVAFVLLVVFNTVVIEIAEGSAVQG